jgi:hypothetical protein
MKCPICHISRRTRQDLQWHERICFENMSRLNSKIEIPAIKKESYDMAQSKSIFTTRKLHHER